MGRILTVGPNVAAIVTSKKKTKKVVGGWTFVISMLDNVQYLSLQLMTLRPHCYNVETSEGVPVTVSAIAQCKIMNTPEFLQIAAEHFLGKHPRQIGMAIQQTLEGHLRAILGVLTVEEIIKDRIKFAHLVREVASVDIAKMGIQIISFVIKDIDDSVGYLSALGKSRTAAVKRDATIGVAVAERDAGIMEAKCDKEANAVKYQMKTSIENHSKLYNLHKADFDAEVNAAKAEAELAYSLKLAQIQQQLRHEQLNIEVIERKKLIEIELKEIERRERELQATIKLPCEAESYRIEAIAKGKKAVVVEDSVGESKRIMKISEAEAFRTKEVGLKEAEKMRKRAITLQSYGDVAIRHLIIKSLPEIASKICAPLAKVEEIILLGGCDDDITGKMATLAAKIPPVMGALEIGNIVKNVLHSKTSGFNE